MCVLWYPLLSVSADNAPLLPDYCNRAHRDERRATEDHSVCAV